MDVPLEVGDVRAELVFPLELSTGRVLEVPMDPVLLVVLIPKRDQIGD